MIIAPDRWSSFAEFFSDTVVQAVLGVLALLVVCSIAFFALSRFRDSTAEDSPLSQLLEKNFEEMRTEGDIDAQEFRKIRALLIGAKPGSESTTSGTDRANDRIASENDADSQDRL